MQATDVVAPEKTPLSSTKRGLSTSMFVAGRVTAMDAFKAKRLSIVLAAIVVALGMLQEGRISHSLSGLVGSLGKRAWNPQTGVDGGGFSRPVLLSSGHHQILT